MVLYLRYLGLTERQRSEIATWRLAAAVSQRMPVTLVLARDHNGGQGDAISLDLSPALESEPWALELSMNRKGLVHPYLAGQQLSARPLLQELARGLALDRADEWLLQEVTAAASLLGQPLARREGGSSLSRGLMLMAEILEAGIAASPCSAWTWRGGVDDSGQGAGPQVQDGLFDGLASAAAELTRGTLAASDLWFLVCSDRVVVGIHLPTCTLLGAYGRWDGDNAGIERALTLVRAAAGRRRPAGPRSSWLPGRRRDFAARAAELAGQVCGDGMDSPMVPVTRSGQLGADKSLTKLAYWFVPSTEQLVLVIGDHEQDKDVVTALAYGLAWQRDRDLIVVLPGGLAANVLRLLPWVRTPVRVFTYDDYSAPEPAVVPTRDEVLAEARCRPRTARADLDLGQRTAWLTGLVDDLQRRHADLVAEHRPGYQAWKHKGRVVLRVQRTGTGLSVTAGVNYSKPSGGQQPAVTVQLTAPATSHDKDRLLAAVAAGVARHELGLDVKDPEHQLQSALAQQPGLGLQARAFAREYPAWRGPGRLGLIDFLTLDKNNALRVVETKVGPDPTVALQALEYAIWVSAWSQELLSETGWAGDAEARVSIDLVLAPDSNGRAFDGYLYGVVEALSGDLPVRVIRADLQPDGTATTAPLSRQQLLAGNGGGSAVTGARWAARMQRHAQTSGGLTGSQLFHPSPTGALLPAAVPVYEDLARRKLLHPYVLHVRSSQAFALNLFAPLDEHGRGQVLTRLGLTRLTEVHPAVFEYSGPDGQDLLRESRPTSPHRTQIDVLLKGLDADGRTVGALIEVKLTEDDFSGCSAYTNPDNPHRHVCRSPGAFGDEPGLCYQLANHGSGQTRAYAELLPVGEAAGPELADDDGGCWIRRGCNQPLRNLALAQALLHTGVLDEAVWAVCAPAQHQALSRRAHEAMSLLPTGQALLADILRPEAVASGHPDGGVAIREFYPFLEDPSQVIPIPRIP